jgi:hypothetical protein
MLHAIPELPENGFGNVNGVLGDEEDTHTLGPNKPDDLLNAGLQYGGQVVEKKMRLIEEEDELGFFRIANFGELLEELAHQPEEEGRIELRGLEELIGGEDVDDSAASAVHLEEVFDIERRFAEELIASLPLQGNKTALD